MKIIIKDGKKYVETSKGGLELACVYDGCDKCVRGGKNGKLFCYRHNNKLSDNDKNAIINKFYIDNLPSNIITKDGKRFKKGTDGRLRELCCVDNCLSIKGSSKFGNYCSKHFKELDEDVREKMENEYKNKQNLLKNKKVIIKNGLRYKQQGKNNKLVALCTYEDCDKFVNYDNSKKYCRIHSKIMPKEKEVEIKHEIIFKDNKKYVKINSGRIILGCVVKDCDKKQECGKYGNYCFKHHNMLPDNEKQKIIDEFEQKKKKTEEKKQKKLVSIATLKTCKIMWKNGQKYVRNKKGNLVYGCNFKGCLNGRDRNVTHEGHCSHHNDYLKNLEGNKKVIKKDNKRYKKKKDGRLIELCNFKNCSSFKRDGEYGNLCQKHYTRLNNKIDKIPKNVKLHDANIEEFIIEDKKENKSKKIVLLTSVIFL
jgi:hypothetical protein